MESLLFNYSFTTRLHDTDAAGVLFFARTFYYAHDAYEAFLNQHYQSIEKILHADFILPIKHAESDYKSPIFLSEKISIALYSQEVKDTGFTLKFYFLDQSQQLKASVLSQHICLDSSTRCKKKLPQSLRSILERKPTRC